MQHYRPATRSLAPRRGAAAVEFAVVAPVFVVLVLTAAQTSFNVDTTHTLYAAVRQAGRLASMDTSERLQAGQDVNSKVIADIRNQLKAEGLPGDEMTISITTADGSAPFDLSDPDNDLELFRISVNVPYSAVDAVGTFTATYEQMQASIVFRKGRTMLVN